MQKEYYVEYSFTKENEKHGFDYIKAKIADQENLTYKIKSNYHDLGDYKSLELYYYPTKDNCECIDDFDCECEDRGLLQAQALEKEIQKDLADIL